MSNPPPTPAERFSGIIRWLVMALYGHSAAGRLSAPLMMLISRRVTDISHRLRRIAARIGAGTYVPHHPAATPRRSPAPHVRRKNPLPHEFAWLVRLMPEAAAFGSQLQVLFADPEMAALLAAAPAPLRRPLRSLCRMLGVTPPPILALPRKAKPIVAEPIVAEPILAEPIFAELTLTRPERADPPPPEPPDGRTAASPRRLRARSPRAPPMPQPA